MNNDNDRKLPPTSPHDGNGSRRNNRTSFQIVEEEDDDTTDIDEEAAQLEADELVRMVTQSYSSRTSSGSSVPGAQAVAGAPPSAEKEKEAQEATESVDDEKAEARASASAAAAAAASISSEHHDGDTATTTSPGALQVTGGLMRAKSAPQASSSSADVDNNSTDALTSLNRAATSVIETSGPTVRPGAMSIRSSFATTTASTRSSATGTIPELQAEEEEHDNLMQGDSNSNLAVANIVQEDGDHYVDVEQQVQARVAAEKQRIQDQIRKDLEAELQAGRYSHIAVAASTDDDDTSQERSNSDNGGGTTTSSTRKKTPAQPPASCWKRHWCKITTLVLLLMIGIGAAVGVYFFVLAPDSGDNSNTKSAAGDDAPAPTTPSVEDNAPTTSPPTALPTLAPSRSPLYFEYQELLVPVFDGDLTVWDDASSPVVQALEWMVYSDTYYTLDTIQQDSTALALFRERYITVLLYFATNGPNWATQYNFLDPATSICTWNDNIDQQGIFCNQNGRALYIILEKNNLKGDLPECLIKLTSLTRLDLHDNSLTGSIPEFIGDLQELVELDLSSNELSGSIPRTLADIQGLLVLVLNNNKLTGTIPDGLTKLPDLAVFAMWNNPGLTGTLPAFADQESLLIVGVYGSRFFDPAPIPPSIWRLPNLMHAYLGNCNFVGELPQDISPMIALQTLSLEKNQLSGSIPPSFLFDSTIQATTFPFLSILELNENELTGPIPLEMAELSNIQRLTLDNNELSGTVPSELARLPKLGTLELQGNNFDGDMNAAFCPMGLPLLEKLVADCYQGNGVIEPEVSCSCCSSCCVNGMACT